MNNQRIQHAYFNSGVGTVFVMLGAIIGEQLTESLIEYNLIISISALILSIYLLYTTKSTNSYIVISFLLGVFAVLITHYIGDYHTYSYILYANFAVLITTWSKVIIPEICAFSILRQSLWVLICNTLTAYLMYIDGMSYCEITYTIIYAIIISFFSTKHIIHHINYTELDPTDIVLLMYLTPINKLKRIIDFRKNKER